jgi:hypothetical protein
MSDVANPATSINTSTSIISVSPLIAASSQDQSQSHGQIPEPLQDEPTKQSKTDIIDTSIPSLAAVSTTAASPDQQTYKPSSIPSIPKLSLGNLANIRESILQNEATIAENRKSLTVDKLKEIWTTYKENQSSKSVQSALHHVILSLESKTLGIIVPNQLSKDMILQESNLIDRLRIEGGEMSLLLNIVIDKSMFPELEDQKPVQTLTQKDKYMQYLELNPHLGNLTQELGLKLDNEIN